MDERDIPLYMIGVAAKLAGMHPQTLRLYERKHLVSPSRSAGSTRLYSERDIERLKLIQDLTHEDGVNLAGVKIIIELRGGMEELEVMMAEMEERMDEMRRLMEEEIERVRKSFRSELVPLPKGELMKRDT